ncbi:arginine--tRNA ligase [Hahella sp. CCB-MM4]|uniref:arginine--tRNA ligase n=1 Tax=Hahella sp. (strain CCB-MM4) TaxID=1926491 RepID=UPI000B9A39E4|nr:arginine--tRNA ligase [Hahella sp. CCB-MM4]OZG71429.1 arginine--tRNA ligase [Hahella sp. CCB-MM4]
MKQTIASLLRTALYNLSHEGTLTEDQIPESILVENSRDKSHGDLATNIALTLAKQVKMPPRQLAESIISRLPSSHHIVDVQIAGPGFINFFLNASSQFEVIGSILAAEDSFGRSNFGQKKRIQVEFVSANPTGPLHVGHGRGAAYGATIAELLKAVGYSVHSEYYVNDAGRQMNILAASVWLRYLESHGESFAFPSNGYKGAYVKDIAANLTEQFDEAFKHPASEVFKDIPVDEPQGGDKEEHIDALILKCRELLGEADYLKVFNAGLNSILDDIKDDLGEFGVHYNQWFSEKSLSEDIEKALAKLDASGHLYEKDGAIWFRSTDFGDDKDRVVKRDNGDATYFASDIAYHLNKFERGFDRVINIWGADHHGYIARVKAALEALGLNKDKLDIKLVQFAILYRGKERVQMSTRSGEFVTLRELRSEVGNDAARFVYVTRKSEQHMDFDLELAKSESKDNPVYYVQYAHARICSVLRKLNDMNLDWDKQKGLEALSMLEHEAEKDLVAQLNQYPEVVHNSAVNLEPHALTHYLRELASNFHGYYNSHKVLEDDARLRDARLTLSMAVRQILSNGLGLLGVSAPTHM